MRRVALVGADEHLVETLERLDASIPTEVLLRPGAGLLAQCSAPVDVEEQVNKSVDSFVVVLGEHEVLSGNRLEALSGAWCRDEGLSGRECLEHLHPHAATDPNRSHDYSCAVEVWRHVGD